MKTLTLAAALIAASFASIPAVAQSDAQRVAITVADLNLGTAEGRAALDLRLLHAARSACGTPSPADLDGVAERDRCVAEARAEATRQRDALVTLASRRSGSVRSAN